MAKVNRFTVLLAIAIITHHSDAELYVNFSAYPIDSQQCLYNAADASGCPTQALTAYEINSCLCGNTGNFVSNSASCVATNDKIELMTVWNTMVYLCASSATPIQYSESDFLAAGSKSGGSSIVPVPQSSTQRAPSTFITSSIAAPKSSQTQVSTTRPLAAFKTRASATPSSSATGNTASKSENSSNNGNNVGKLSGGVIGLISAISGLAALTVAFLTWCGCYRRRRDHRMLG